MIDIDLREEKRGGGGGGEGEREHEKKTEKRFSHLLNLSPFSWLRKVLHKVNSELREPRVQQTTNPVDSVKKEKDCMKAR